MKRTEPQLAGNAHRKWAFSAAKLALGVGLVWWLIQSGRFDPGVYGALLQERTACFLLGVFLSQWIMLLVPFVRWWLLARATGLPISLGEAVRLGLKGAFANLFVPGGLGIDGVRLLHLRRYHRRQFLDGAASVVLDRALGVLALLILGGVCSLILLARNHSPWMLRLVLVNGLLLVVLLAALGIVCGFVRPQMLDRLRHIRLLDHLLHAFHAYRGHRRTLAWGLLLSLIGHVGVCCAAAFALLSLGYPAFLSAVFTATPIVTVARSIPLTPLGLGVSDSVAAFLYPVVGLQGGAEVQMLLRASVTLIFLTCGVAYLRVRPEVVSRVPRPVDLAEDALVGGRA
ncbi:MAG TPA: lysylphosphatidylglycerol synthase transmembrane domain-containing protein [Thermoguttaceae bacterium]|nr:lysylphosphatidylglycerol synthase transmembrane domain-containing protein [Thermoguttaceae bacterium]